jgi:ApbE superfamily uncharacterized protein (UPF0280 family)
MRRYKFHSAALALIAGIAIQYAVMMASVLTNLGEQWACDRMTGVSALDGHFVGWGTGAGTAAKADTTLFTEAAEARATATVTTNGTGASAKAQWVATIVSASAQSITNAANFTASTAGTMIVKGDFAATALAIGESITFTITLDPG